MYMQGGISRSPIVIFSVLTALLLGGFFTVSLAASCTALQGSDTLSASRSVLNDCFSSIVAELTYQANSVIISGSSSATKFRIFNSSSSTVLTVDTIGGSTTVAGIVHASSFYATSTTASSTFRGGLIAEQALRLSHAGFANCNLDTDANGYLQCGSDATGAGAVTINSGTLNRFAVYGGTDAIYSGNPFQMSTSTGSSTWPIINVGTLTATTGTSYLAALQIGSLSGLLQGNGAGQPITAITDSSTGGQVLRVTGASVYAWGALDLGDNDARTGVLPLANGGTANTGYIPGTYLAFDGNGLVSTSSNLTAGFFVATTTATSTFAGPIKVGTGFIKDAIETKGISFGATSTLAYYGAASATHSAFFSYPVSITKFYCKITNGGTFNAIIGDGAGTSTLISVTGTRTETSASIAVTENETIYIVVGAITGNPVGGCFFDYIRTN